MRNAFFKTLFELAERDARIVLIVGDLGFSVVEAFRARFPKQFINAGVAEQNMTGLAAGMALCGKIVFTYSIGNFPILRCLEQVRNDVCYHAADVKIVTVGGGFAYGALGFSHHATEDLAVTLALPGMTVVAPGDPVETVHATRAIVDRPGPCYMRLGRAGEAPVHPVDTPFVLGKALLVRPGRDLTLMSTGSMLQSALEAARQLAGRGLDPRVLSVHTLKPFDVDSVKAAAYETAALVTVEEHSEVGGLGSLVAEVLCGHGLHTPLRRLAIPSTFAPVAGSQEFLRARYGLTVQDILETAGALLATRRPLPARS